MRTLVAAVVTAVASMSVVACGSTPSTHSSSGSAASTNDVTQISCPDEDGEPALTLTFNHLTGTPGSAGFDADGDAIVVSGTADDGTTVSFQANAFGEQDLQGTTTLLYLGSGTINPPGGDSSDAGAGEGGASGTIISSLALIFPDPSSVEADPAPTAVIVRLSDSNLNGPSDVANDTGFALSHGTCSASNIWAAETLKP